MLWELEARAEQLSGKLDWIGQFLIQSGSQLDSRLRMHLTKFRSAQLQELLRILDSDPSVQVLESRLQQGADCEQLLWLIGIQIPRESLNRELSNQACGLRYDLIRLDLDSLGMDHSGIFKLELGLRWYLEDELPRNWYLFESPFQDQLIGFKHVIKIPSQAIQIAKLIPGSRIGPYLGFRSWAQDFIRKLDSGEFILKWEIWAGYAAYLALIPPGDLKIHSSEIAPSGS